MMVSTLQASRPALVPAAAASPVTESPLDIAGPIPLVPDADMEDEFRERLRALANDFDQSNADAWSSASPTHLQDFKTEFQCLQQAGGGNPSCSTDSLGAASFTQDTRNPTRPEANFSVQAMTQLASSEPQPVASGSDRQQQWLHARAHGAFPLYGFPGGELFLDTPSCTPSYAQAAKDMQLSDLGNPGAFW